MSNEITSAVFGLLGTIIGGVIAYYSIKGIEEYKIELKSNTLASSIKAEISSILTLVNKRKYLDGFKNHLQELKENNTSEFYNFSVNRDYFKVYNSTINDIGLLGSELTEKIVTFYSSVNAFIENLEACKNREFENYNLRERIEYHEEMIKFLTDCIKMGENIISNLDSFIESRKFHRIFSGK